MRVSVHVTPRQRNDQRRPYVRDALDRWVHALGSLGIHALTHFLINDMWPVGSHLYFENKPDSRSMQTHFECLKAFHV